MLQFPTVSRALIQRFQLPFELCVGIPEQGDAPLHENEVVFAAVVPGSQLADVVQHSLTYETPDESEAVTVGLAFVLPHVREVGLNEIEGEVVSQALVGAMVLTKKVSLGPGVPSYKLYPYVVPQLKLP